MAVALLPLHNFFASLQGLFGWLRGPIGRVRDERPRLGGAPAGVPALRAAIRPTPERAARPRRPLRVVRVFEGGRDRGGAGRMMISGRFADVCAELDRLAAQEARGHERGTRH